MSTNEKWVLEMLGDVGAVITGSHIVYTSGKHGTDYINKDAVYPHTTDTSRLCRTIAEQFVRNDVRVVIGPAIGGVILSQWTAYHLSRMYGREVFGIYAEKAKDGDAFVIKRGYDKFIVEKKRVLVVEDVLTTGGSVKKVVEAVREAGGEVIGVAALCNRGNVKAEDIGSVPRFCALLNLKLDSWDEATCPLCEQNVPINTDVGKGREFLARKLVKDLAKSP